MCVVFPLAASLNTSANDTTDDDVPLTTASPPTLLTSKPFSLLVTLPTTAPLLFVSIPVLNSEFNAFVSKQSPNSSYLTDAKPYRYGSSALNDLTCTSLYTFPSKVSMYNSPFTSLTPKTKPI